MKLKQSLFLVLVMLLLIPSATHAQAWSGIIAPSRATNWSNAGVVGGIPNRTTVCSTLNPGATAAQINSAISACPSGQVVMLNAGTYTLSGGIVFNNKSGVTLRGAGPDKTILSFNSGGGCAGWSGADVCFMTTDSGDAGDGNYSNQATWSAGYAVGTTSITLSSVTKGSISNLQIGSQIFLDQLDDASDPGGVFVCSTMGVCSSSGSSSNGRTNRGQDQIARVTSISGSGPWTIGLDTAIRMPNIVSSKSPQAWWDNGLPVQNDGLESLTVDNTNNPTTDINGIFFLNGYNDWVKNVRSVNAAQKHVWLYQTTHTTIRDSYFYGSPATSDHYATDTFVGADNLIENNISQHIGFPNMNEGDIGTVVSYNFAADDYYTGTPIGSATDWQQASSYHHSVGDAFILWEGNQGIGWTSDAIHGTSNFLTGFRNYWNGRDIAGGSSGGKVSQTVPILIYAYNRYFNVIGNVLGTTGYHNQYQAVAPSGTNYDTSIYGLAWSGNGETGSIPNDPFVVTSLLRWGNYDTFNNAARFVTSEVPSALSGFPNPVPGSQLLPASFYLTSRPAWWPSTIPFPPIGPDVTGGNMPNIGGHANMIPAANCYLNIMGGKTDGTSGLLTFNANSCYGTTAVLPAPATGVSAVAH